MCVRVVLLSALGCGLALFLTRWTTPSRDALHVTDVGCHADALQLADPEELRARCQRVIDNERELRRQSDADARRSHERCVS